MARSSAVRGAVWVAALLFATGARAATVEEDAVQFHWAAATGPVSEYGVWVTRNGVEGTQPQQFVPIPSVAIGGSPGDQISIRTAAFDAVGEQGPFSSASELVLFVLPTPPPPIPAPEPPPEEPIPPEPSPEDPLGDVAPPAFDFDGDGRSDLLWLDQGRRKQTAWLMEDRAPRKILATVRRTLPEAWAHTSTADFDADGGADLLWSNPLDGAALVQHMPAGAAQESVVLGFPGAGWAALALGNEPAPDGRARVLWVHPDSGSAMLWRGAGHDDPSPEESAMSTSPGRSPVVACDVDGDGLRDAVLADATTLEVVRVGIAEVWTAAIEEGESIRGCGDVDGDGRARVLLQQGQHGSLRIVTWSSAGHGSEQHLTSPRPRELVAVGDYDGDGQAELVLRRFDRVYIASVDEVESADPSADLPPLEERVARRQQALSTAW